jgi:hypothetical protein
MRRACSLRPYTAAARVTDVLHSRSARGGSHQIFRAPPTFVSRSILALWNGLRRESEAASNERHTGQVRSERTSRVMDPSPLQPSYGVTL